MGEKDQLTDQLAQKQSVFDDQLAKGREMRDPWKHRSRHMLCFTCMFFVPKVPEVDFKAQFNDAIEEAEPEKAPLMGRCRRHAPTMAGYPVVFEHDWCGDHKLDENAHAR